jgi:hypothetical protein
MGDFVAEVNKLLRSKFIERGNPTSLAILRFTHLGGFSFLILALAMKAWWSSLNASSFSALIAA